MKILYVSPLVVGFEDILDGRQDSRGLPSFILPLQTLLKDGHQVDIVLISNYHREMNITVDWIKRENIVLNVNNNLTKKGFGSKIINKLKTSFQLVSGINKLIAEKKYDFVYCHGKAGVIANIIANVKKVPCGYRLYGTYDLYDCIQRNGKVIAAIKNFVFYMIFRLRKSFLLITDDGTQGNRVYESIKNPPNYKFFFWKNGVDFYNIHEALPCGHIPEHPYLFMGGRIFSGKRQDRVIKVLRLLHEKGLKLHLYFSGHLSPDNQSYYQELLSLIDSYKLGDYVHFLGAIERSYMQQLSYHAVAMVTMNDYSNLGNVFYELFSSGSVVICIDDHSLDEYICNGVNGFLVQNEEEAADIVFTLSSNDQMRCDIKKSAIETAQDKMLSWEERVRKELFLIETAVSTSRDTRKNSISNDSIV